MAKKAPAPEKDNSERWLLTYSDLMNLLLILFIIFYAMSEADKVKAEKVAESIRAGFGYVKDGGTGEASGEGSGLYGADFTTPGDGEFVGGGALASDAAAGDSGGQDAYWTEHQNQQFQKFYDEIVQLLQDNNLENMVDVKLDDTGVVISFKDNALFASGKADLNSDSSALIDNIGGLLKTLDFTYILVEGHTDTVPIHTSQYVDNMDLSTQRAANVWRELVRLGLDPEKMASIGYGEFRPVAKNDTPENKAKNRRVVITIMRNLIQNSGEIVTNPSGEPVEVIVNPTDNTAAAAAAGANP
jgi:chemotaxis protein MotB